jgi:tRNA threonylcarbamoyladenosine biosynthesis protein TsaE
MTIPMKMPTKMLEQLAKPMRLSDPAATDAFALEMAAHFRANDQLRMIFLTGPLGAGKSSFARALLRALGVTGPIKSPTYTLVEPYQTAFGSILHLDLYRLSDGAELEFLGLREAFSDARLMLIEWPERAIDALPKPDLWLHFDYADALDERIVQLRQH